MKKKPPNKSASQFTNSQKHPAVRPSAAAQQLGGQPENDQDAQDAGFESATAGAKGNSPNRQTDKRAS